MRVWRLVITGNQEQLENPSLNKEKSEELSEQNKQQKEDNNDQQNNQNQNTPNTMQDGDSQENENSNQSDNGQSQQSNQDSQQADQSSNSSQNSSQNQSSDSQQTDSSSQESNQSDNSQQRMNQNQPSQSQQQSSTQEQKDNQSNATSNQNESQDKSSSNQNSQNLNNNSQQSNIQDNQGQESDSNEDSDDISYESPKQKNKRKRKEKKQKKNVSSSPDEENIQEKPDKGRWKKNKPNRQNPKNDFPGIYRKQKKKIKQQQEKTQSARAKQKAKQKIDQITPEISQESQDILNELQQIPPFEERDHGGGIAKLGIQHDELPASLIRMLIQKFVNQRFKKKKSDLNIRGTSIEKKQGFHKWDVPQIAKHLKSKQYTEIMTDKYSYEYANGANETIPLSFYFDLSGSMVEYNPLLVVIIRELLKTGVKVLIGANEQLTFQIDAINPNIKDEEILDIFKYIQRGRYIKESSIKGLKCKNIYGRRLYEYLKEKKAEKCVVFSDFDPIQDVIKLSKIAQVYWFGFENIYYGSFYHSDYSSAEEYLPEFKGFYYKVQDADDIVYGLGKINSNRFEALCYIDDQKQNIKRRN